MKKMKNNKITYEKVKDEKDILELYLRHN